MRAFPPASCTQVLKLDSPTGQSYGDRIEHARTEKQLSDIFEDFTGSLPLGRALFAGWNPIRTRGPMQVNVAFADQFAATHTYPYPVNVSIDEELFSRRGSLYFGTAHLLDYSAPYDRYLYRFADFNAGQYSSRNAAFQQALKIVSGKPLAADGALLPHDGGQQGRRYRTRGALPVGETASGRRRHPRGARGRAQRPDSSKAPCIDRCSASRSRGCIIPCRVPRSRRSSSRAPKSSDELTTEWYARRVDGRFQAASPDEARPTRRERDFNRARGMSSLAISAVQPV